MSPDELQQKLAETRKELFNLRFQSATGSLEDTTRLQSRAPRHRPHPHRSARAREGAQLGRHTDGRRRDHRRDRDPRARGGSRGAGGRGGGRGAAAEEPSAAEEADRPRRRPSLPPRRSPSRGARGGGRACRGPRRRPSLPPRPRRPRSRGRACAKKRKRLPRALRHKHSKPARTPSKERKPIARTPKQEAALGRRQERRGVVVSDKGDKTIVVRIETVRIHAKYKKVIRRSSKLHAHDEANSAGIGDIVRVDRDPAALEDQALAPGRDRGEGQMTPR